MAPRVFIADDAIHGSHLVLDGALARHLAGALRLRPGEDLVAVTTDGIEHQCKVVSATSRRVEAQVLRSLPSRQEPRLQVRVCASLLKADQFERILEYCTELGATSFQPIVAERSVPRLSAAKLDSRTERWREVLRGAAELGRRGRVPELLPLATLSVSIARSNNEGAQSFVLYEGSGLPPLSGVDVDVTRPVCLFVGPEGGWSDAEVTLVRDLKALPVSLGPRIMRPLPAALTALTLLLHRSRDLQSANQEDMEAR